MQVLQGKIDILSSNGLDANITAPSTPSAIKAFNPESDPIVQYVNQQMEAYVKQMRELAEEMQNALQHISDELATEVAREQQHLMLMQDQVTRSFQLFSATLAFLHCNLHCAVAATMDTLSSWRFPFISHHVGL